ncbi:MAG: Gfo/Idh/MocA family oxidoreductase [Kiritimatiellae bacterium]|nr:Gfo/Idh/MocA family oxidoreductase [Kiritimatiellia bacterium]MDD5519400.1 Gfo/Idh/MocA family oxidoreductase [Kiritimatiellia bacterium]
MSKKQILKTSHNHSINRRQFLRTITTVAAASIIPASVLGKNAPSNRITMGCIGVGGMGMRDLRAAMVNENVQIIAACDPVSASNEYGHWFKDGWQGPWFGRDSAKKVVEHYYAQQTGRTDFKCCDAYIDFRELLARDDIDTVTVVTPDHWHAPITVAAARAGKDIYCEKPLSLTLVEGRAMVKAVRQHGCILQTGTHRRSSPAARHFCELIRNGRLGKLRKITIEIGKNHRKGPEGYWEAQPVPAWLDYDMWLGPAPWAPYHKDRCLYSFRFISDYSGGNVTNLGAHAIDLVQWATGNDMTGPVEVEDLGGVFPPEGLFDVANPAHFRCRYADNTEFECHTGERSAHVTFEGERGWLGFDDVMTASSPELLRETIGPDEIHLYESNDHMRNFIDCVKSRREPAGPVEVGHRSASICHLGNIAMTLKAKLQWDPVAEHFIGKNATSANRLLHHAYRGPWTL